jgi:hypothetical protein
VFFYRQGDSEMLHARFPTIALALVHKVIAFYLETRRLWMSIVSAVRKR